MKTLTHILTDYLGEGDDFLGKVSIEELENNLSILDNTDSINVNYWIKKSEVFETLYKQSFEYAMVDYSKGSRLVIFAQDLRANVDEEMNIKEYLQKIKFEKTVIRPISPFVEYFKTKTDQDNFRQEKTHNTIKKYLTLLQEYSPTEENYWIIKCELLNDLHENGVVNQFGKGKRRAGLQTHEQFTRLTTLLKEYETAFRNKFSKG